MRWSQKYKTAFTLVELLATIAIVAILVISVMVVIPSFLNWATKTRNQHSLLLLNQALDIYKGLGGLSKAHSLQGPNSQDKIDAVIDAMKAGVTVGKTKQAFWKDDNAIDTTQLYVKGDGKNFYFCGYGISQSGATLASFAGSYQKHAMGKKAANRIRLIAGASGSPTWGPNSSSGCAAVQLNGGTISYYGNGWASLPAVVDGDVLEIWSCVADKDPTPSGVLTAVWFMTWNGLLPYSAMDFSNYTGLTNFLGADPSIAQTRDFTGCTGLKTIVSPGNNLTSINVTGCTALESLTLYGNVGLTPTSFGNNYPALQVLHVQSSSINTVSVNGCSALTTFDMEGDDYMTSASVLNCPVLSSIRIWGAGALTAINYSNCPSTQTVVARYINGALPPSVWVNFYNALPVTTSGTFTQGCNDGGDRSVATGKGWTFIN